jgi:hypothetical protein
VAGAVCTDRTANHDLIDGIVVAFQARVERTVSQRTDPTQC